MTKTRISALLVLLFIFHFSGNNTLTAQIVPVGDGSYTTLFPGTDAAGRNTYPPGTPQLSGLAVGRPVPTNDWWASLLNTDHVSNLFNYPMALKTKTSGLVVSYIPWGVYDDQEPIVVGVTALNASRATVADYSDWTVTMDWNGGGHHLQVTSGIAMPFLYFTKSAEDEVQIKVNLGTASVSGEMLIVENARNGADFVFYAPTGSAWIQNGNTYTSSLNGKDYWSMAMLPQSASNISAVAEEYKKYAYVFPVNTTASWTYDAGTSVMRTDFLVETETKEGSNSNILMGLLPHQWANLAADSPVPDQYSYNSIRGELKTMDGNSFSVENTYYGILPTLPYLDNYSPGFSLTSLNQKVIQLENDGLSSWTDSYNDGQMINRLIQTARIAHEMGNIEARDKMIATIKERVEDWLSAELSEIAFLFYYNATWTALLGYPAGHGQDGNLNDHHFHWGYYIHAAAFLEQFEPGWAAKYGDMVNLLVRDAASPKRNDDKFPYLRSFSPYAGHCWANGFATFPQGNDQESTSESMQFNSSLIHWGTITANDEIRDLGIYLYTTEQTAIEEYWFDMYERNFSASQQYSLVSRVWGNSYDNGTFWTSDIAASYGIELYPIHGGSLYLGHNTDYVQKLWTEMENNTGILTNQANDNLWHDIYWEYLAFIDPGKAIQLYDSYPERSLKFGVSDAQTYYWLHSMNVLGKVDVTLTADYPIAAVFVNGEDTTYVAHNYSAEPLSVHFSNGYILNVPPASMTTNKDIDINSRLDASYSRAYVNGSVMLTLEVESGVISKVELYDGEEMIAEMSDAPYTFKADSLDPGIHYFYAKIYDGSKLDVSNIVKVIVGNQTPFNGSAWTIPGEIEPGKYDNFEGGSGQGISYSDLSLNNEGDYRPNESADASYDFIEGAIIGSTAGGEWLEYTVHVQTAGLYSLDLRYSSGNENGGGPFHLELDDKAVSEDIYIPGTGKWTSWSTKTVPDIPLAGGEHILKINIGNGEFNLGRLTFNYQGELPYSQPVANAGDNIVVVLPGSTADLDGSLSTDPASGSLTYSWEQIYGPSTAQFSDSSLVSPQLSSLEKGVYLIRLTISNGSYSDFDELYVIVSTESSLAPTVSVNFPKNNDEFIQGKPITLMAAASDLDGTVSQVEFFINGISVGTSSTEPFTLSWTSDVGEYSLYVKASDNDGNTAISKSIQIILTEAPPCNGTSFNGDFEYLFSDDASNPSLTFIPSITGVGNPVCILYYGTNASGSYGGIPVSPNVPYKITAEEGSTVYFYYTYSYPGQGEKNTAGNMNSYVVGSCISLPMLILSEETFTIEENTANGTLIGSPETEYTGSGTLTYSILSGNESGAFEINSETGEIRVVDSEKLDYETTTKFVLEVQVSDSELTDAASITINLTNVVEVGNASIHAKGISVYPNPFTNKLSIRWTDFQSVSVYELSGRKLMTSNKNEIFLGNLPGGIYILTLKGTSDEVIHYKVIKH